MQSITPYLWFDKEAEEAMTFYTSVFKDSKVLSTNPGPDGKAMIVEFELNGQKFIGLNGGPAFKFTEAISFVVDVDTQEEVDYYWKKWTADGGEESMCGWIKDKYGLSWQIIPKALMKLLSDPNPARAGRATQAMLKMKKIVIADLEKAANEE